MLCHPNSQGPSRRALSIAKAQAEDGSAGWAFIVQIDATTAAGFRQPRALV
jgi:hypothetical protein